MICSRIRCPDMRSETGVGSSLYQSSPQPKLLYSMHQNTQRHVSINLKRQLWSLLHSSRPCPDHFLKSHGRTFGKKPKVEVLKQSIQIWGALDCCRHLLWRFFMVLKHMNCLLNVIIENFLKSHGRTKKLKSSLTGVVIDLIWKTFLYESHCFQ